MTRDQFEALLNRTADRLTKNLRSSFLYHGPKEFEQGVLDMLRIAAEGYDLVVEPTYHPHAFPDIRVNGFGVEVKFSKRNTWTAVGNSVFETMRDPNVRKIYVMFGKTGGEVEARWARYEDCVAHVRVSNAPRFVIDMDRDESPLFKRFDISYDRFSRLDEHGKMEHIREYWRNRLPIGERLWWLEPSHTLPINVRLYTHLTPNEKRTLRAEAALLCPRIVQSGSVRGKYYDAAVYALTHWGVLCPQARDLFSAGSVAGQVAELHANELYISRALRDIESIMVERAYRLDGALFVEYWGNPCAPEERLNRWLEMADHFATDWKPSDVLFRD